MSTVSFKAHGKKVSFKTGTHRGHGKSTAYTRFVKKNYGKVYRKTAGSGQKRGQTAMKSVAEMWNKS